MNHVGSRILAVFPRDRGPVQGGPFVGDLSRHIGRTPAIEISVRLRPVAQEIDEERRRANERSLEVLRRASAPA